MLTHAVLTQTLPTLCGAEVPANGGAPQAVNARASRQPSTVVLLTQEEDSLSGLLWTFLPWLMDITGHVWPDASRLSLCTLQVVAGSSPALRQALSELVKAHLQQGCPEQASCNLQVVGGSARALRDAVEEHQQWLISNCSSQVQRYRCVKAFGACSKA